MKRIPLLLLPLLLAACGGTDEGQDSPQAQNVPEKTIPAQSPVDKALSAIPPEDRRDFQKAIMCEVKRNKETGIDITPEFISDLQDRVKKDPSLTEC